MPAASKIAPANELFMDEEVPNARLKSGKTIISTCKLCLQPFFDPSPTRKACHLLGIPGSGISKCEHRGDLPEEIKLLLKDSCEPVSVVKGFCVLGIVCRACKTLFLQSHD